MGKIVALVVAFTIASMPASSAASVKGSQGQLLSVSKTTVKSGSVVTVKGNYFDETVGIYLAFCVIPAKGKAPTPCGGGVNKAGLGEASFGFHLIPTVCRWFDGRVFTWWTLYPEGKDFKANWKV